MMATPSTVHSTLHLGHISLHRLYCTCFVNFLDLHTGPISWTSILVLHCKKARLVTGLETSRV